MGLAEQKAFAEAQLAARIAEVGVVENWFPPNDQFVSYFLLLTSARVAEIVSGVDIDGVSKFGRNDVVGSTEAVVSDGGVFGSFLTTASTARIKAGGNVNDTAVGTGAREITIVGLDENFDPAEEAVATAGASASASTTTTFIRVFRSWASAVGTYSSGTTGGNNDGDVVIETTGGTDLIQIGAGRGQSETTAYTIPAGMTGYLRSIDVNVDGTKAARADLWVRENADVVSAPFDAKRIRKTFSDLTGYASKVVFRAVPLLEKTDIWVTATKTEAGGTTAVNAEFDIVLTTNG